MKIAIISDLHANLTATDALLADLRSEKPDAVVCLGDVAVTGPQPRQTLERLRKLGGPVVMGNTDEWMLDPRPVEAADEDARRMGEIELWCAEQLTPEDRDYVRTFLPWVEIELEGSQTMLCYHGSPTSNTERISATTPDEQIEAMLGTFQPTVMAGGHTHQALLRTFNGILVINPGSVGLPYLTVNGLVRNPTWAEYALIETRRGSLKVDFRRVGYDLEALRRAARASGMPHAEWWLQDWR